MSLRPVVPLLPLEVVARSACRDEDPAIFYPAGEGRFVTSNDPAAYDPARAICAACPVLRDCLDHALAVPERDGMWGGTTPGERKRIRSRRAAAAREGAAHAL